MKLLVVIAKFVKKRAIKRANKQYDLKREKEEEKEAIEKLWQSVDALSPGDRQTLKLLIENNNTPIEESSGCFYDFGSLFMSNWIVSTTVPYEFEDQDNQPVLNSNGIPIANFMNQGKKLYKLKDDVFQWHNGVCSIRHLQISFCLQWHCTYHGKILNGMGLSSLSNHVLPLAP